MKHKVPTLSDTIHKLASYNGIISLTKKSIWRIPNQLMYIHSVNLPIIATRKTSLIIANAELFKTCARTRLRSMLNRMNKARATFCTLNLVHG